MNFFRLVHEYCLGLLGMHEFLHLIIYPLREYFLLYFAPPPPLPHKLSIGPSLITNS